MRLQKTIFAGLFATTCLLFTETAGATPITGSSNIAGNVTVSGTSITFMPTFVATAGATETGAFTGLLGGTIQSLTGGPVTGNTFVPDFVSFTTGVAAPVFFDLTYIAPGVGTVAACSSSVPGAARTPSGSPFTLFQLSSNTVIAALQLNGNSYTGSAASGSSPTTSIFSTQTVLNGTIPQIVGLLQSGQTLTGITYSASFQATAPTPSIPEPATVTLLGLGLAVAGVTFRRKT